MGTPFLIELGIGELHFPTVYSGWSFQGGPEKFGLAFPFAHLSVDQAEGLEPKEFREEFIINANSRWRPTVGLFDADSATILTDRSALLVLSEEFSMRDVENRTRDSVLRELPSMIEVEKFHYRHPMRTGWCLLLRQVWLDISELRR